MNKFIEQMMEIGAWADKAGSQIERDNAIKAAEELYDKHLAELKLLGIADVIVSTSFKNDLEKAIEMGESIGFNEDGGYDYFSQSDALEAVMNVLKKYLL